jgi:hypothetical protein
MLHELHRYLHGRAERQVRNAETIVLLRSRGYSHAACRQQLGLTADEYRRAKRWLRDGIAAVTLSASRAG